jgi:WD40 repeat protein
MTNDTFLMSFCYSLATGSPQAMIWWHSSLLTIGYISSIVNVFSPDGSSMSSGQGAPTTAVCHLQWHSAEQDLLWIGGYMGLTLARIERIDQQTSSSSPTDTVVFTIVNSIVDESSLRLTPVVDRMLHQTAACGLHIDNESIYSGDLSGNIFQWHIHHHQPVQRWHIPDSIRCFISDTLVGTLSGALYNFITGEIVDDFQTAIICSAWNREKTSCLIGLADGKLLDLQTRRIVGLHENNAEIWSVCWSPDEDRCATASEDQTTCLWSINGEQTLLATLRGHTTAVTAVQWKNERIYTCADDRTVRIYRDESNRTYQCYRVLRTPQTLFGWFTLTYLQIDLEQHLIMSTTQNGYLVVWRDNDNAHDELPIFCQKIHFGSLEGFIYDEVQHRLVVTSSDCSVTCLRLTMK